MRVAINGTGRIGRLLMRRLLEMEEFDLVAVNDLMPIENLIYLFKYDSLFGAYSHQVTSQGEYLMTGNRKIQVLNEPDPGKLPWAALGIDVVLECSGKFISQEAASDHLKAGAKRVLLSTTGLADIPLLIYGFNHSGLTDAQRIISPGGCMTNCAIHVLYLLNSISIRSAHINFIHSYTSRQSLVDSANGNFRRGRAASESIIPVSIDLKQSLERLMPGIKGKIEATSTRVPVANGALGIFSVQLNDEVSSGQINEVFKKAAANAYSGIIQYTEEPIVSLDVKGNSHSCIIDGSLTSVVGNHVTVSAWFDNEYGYTSRIIDWLKLIHQPR